MPRKVAKQRGANAAQTIVEVANRQHGAVAVRQLTDVSREAIRAALHAGWLLRLHRGVYSLASPPTRRRIWMAAVLACGVGAVLSHASAAALWRIRGPVGGPVHVTVLTPGGRARRDGIAVHRRNRVLPDEISEHEGIPVTSPARTLLDLAAAGVAPRDLERAADEAERLRLCSGEDLQAMVALHAGRPGSGRLRALLEEHEVGSTLTRLELEERFLALCRKQEIPKPLVNSEVLGLKPDFFWPRAGLAVEVDGRGSHDTRRGFQDDRDRDSLLISSGYRVMRFTWWDVLRRPGVVAHRVKLALG